MDSPLNVFNETGKASLELVFFLTVVVQSADRCYLNFWKMLILKAHGFGNTDITTDITTDMAFHTKRLSWKCTPLKTNMMPISKGKTSLTHLNRTSIVGFQLWIFVRQELIAMAELLIKMSLGEALIRFLWQFCTAAPFTLGWLIT